MPISLERRRRLYKERIAQGLCGYMGCSDKRETGKSLCRRHLDVKNEQERGKDYSTIRSLKRKKKLEQGLCAYSGCPAKHETGKSMCRQHLNMLVAHAQRRRAGFRQFAQIVLAKS